MKIKLLLLVVGLAICTHNAFGESPYTIFDDKTLLDGYAEKYAQEPKEILLAMIKDETLTSYKTAAAVRVFKEHFSEEVFAREKKIIERILWRRLNRTSSPFIQIEIMHTLCIMDRHKYFKHFIPDLIRKIDHYNKTVNEMAYNSINRIIEAGHNRRREAGIVFVTLRKMLFLSRRKLQNIEEPGPKLKQKLELLRWSIKILGTQELKRLPPEVISLL